MYILCNGMPPWSFSHSNEAGPIHLISPVHSLESAVSTVPCRVQAVQTPNCETFPCGGQEQEQLVNTAPPQLPDCVFISFPCGSAASSKVEIPFELIFCKFFKIIL